MGTLDMGRDKVDTAVRITGRAFYRGAVEASAALYEAIQDAARKRGLDPRYVMYVLLSHGRSWEQAAGRNADALRLARELYVAGEHQPPRGMDMPAAEQERDVDAAIAEVAAWAATTFVERLTDVFLAVGREGGKLVKEALEDEYGKPASERQARNVLVKELILRVRDHGFWFKDPVTLNEILSLLFQL